MKGVQATQINSAGTTRQKVGKGSIALIAFTLVLMSVLALLPAFAGATTPTLEVGKFYTVDVGFKNASNLANDSSAKGYFDTKAVIQPVPSGYYLSIFQTTMTAQAHTYMYDKTQSDVATLAASAATAALREESNSGSDKRIITVFVKDISRTLLVSLKTPSPNRVAMRLVFDSPSIAQMTDSNYLGFDSARGLKVGKLYMTGIRFKQVSYAPPGNNPSDDSSSASNFDVKAVVQLTPAGYVVRFFQTDLFQYIPIVPGYKYDLSQSDDNTSAEASLVAAGRISNYKKTADCITVNWTDLERSLLLNMGVIQGAGSPVIRSMRLLLDESSAAEMTGFTYQGFVFSTTADPILAIIKTDLNSEITKANAKVEADFTSGSWASFQTALENALEILDETDATQGDVNTATDELKIALSGLVSIKSLNSEITIAKTKVEADYTSTSWSTFKTSLSSASAVSGNADATQNEVDDALNALQSTINNLVLRPIVTVSAGTGGTVTGGGTFDIGIKVSLTAKPKSGYRFVNWTENGKTASNLYKYEFNAAANRTLKANFAKIGTAAVSVSPLSNKSKMGRLKVSWKSVTGAYQFEIYRSTKSGSGFSKIKTVSATTKSLTDSRLKKNKKYYYKIKAVCKAGSVITKGEYSKVKYGKTKR